MSMDSCLQRPKSASATVYLMEELGDARMRCDQLVKYTAEAVKLIEGSSHRDHFFEVAGHLIQALPQTVFLLQKALQATALAATRIDYEEIKQELRPEKVEQLERALQDARIRQVQRRSQPWTPIQAADAIRAMVARVQETGNLPMKELVGLVLSLEFGLKKAEAESTAAALEAVATSLETADTAPSQLHLAAALRQVLADDLLRTSQEQPFMDETMNWKVDDTRTADQPAASISAASRTLRPGEEEVVRIVALMRDGELKGFRVDSPTGQEYGLKTLDLALAAAKKTAPYAVENILHRGTVDPSKMANAAEEAKRSRFEEGKPADPTQNMSPEDAKRWKEEHDKHKDNFKSGAALSEDIQNELLGAALALRNAAKGQRPKNNAITAVRLLASALFKMGEPRAYDVLSRAADVMQASGMWDLTQKKQGEDEEKSSKFEEGKPADPTENMSPEDAKKWKTEHDKHKDNFKTADSRAIGQQLKDAFDFGIEKFSKGATADASDVAKVAREIAGILKEFSIPGFKTPDSFQRIGRELERYMILGGTAAAEIEKKLDAKYGPRTANDEEKSSKFEEGKPADPTENMSPEDAKKWKTEHDKHKDNFKSAAGLEGELREMQDILKSNGYNPADATKLQEEGMGPYELEHRIKTTKPGEMGSLEYTHGLKRSPQEAVLNLEGIMPWVAGLTEHAKKVHMLLSGPQPRKARAVIRLGGLVRDVATILEGLGIDAKRVEMAGREVQREAHGLKLGAQASEDEAGYAYSR